MTQDAIIQIRDLVNCFGVQCVHQGLNLDVKRGEVLGVVGGSGTGKSVLLRSIVGLRRPTDGKIHVFGKDLSDSYETYKKHFTAYYNHLWICYAG